MPLVRPVSTLSVVLLLVLGGGSAVAGEPAPTHVCPREQGSLGYLSCSLAASLLPSAAGAEVVVVELKTDRELPAADALKQRLQSTVQQALAKSVAPPPAASAPKLRVELRVEKSAGLLRITADVKGAVGLWQRIRKAKPRTLAHAFVEAPIDAELRTLIPPPPLVVSEVLKLKAPERGIVALACGAFGPEGGQELALVSRSNVRVGRIAGRAFQERAKVGWAALSAIAPTPLREPIATADVSDNGRLRVGISDRKDGVELDVSLKVVARFEALLPAPGGGCVARAGLGLAGKISGCGGPGVGAAFDLSAPLDALAGDGAARVGRELASGKLRQATGELASLGRVGAQLALGDADRDGAPELAYSADVLEPGRDRLSLVTLNGAKASRRFELPAAGISAIALCQKAEGAGMAPIALISGEELWLIR